MQSKKFLRFKLFTFALLTLNLFSFAIKADEVMITGYIADGPKMSQVYAGYLTITNSSNEAIELIAASSSAFNGIQMHLSEITNGMMKMKQLQSIEVKAQQQLVMKPGSYHLMLIEKLKAIHLDDVIDVELFFADGSTRSMMLKVQKRQMHSNQMMNH